MDYQTVYATRTGQTHDAIQIQWNRVAEILGHEHEGTPEDDAALVEHLKAQGAPEWVKDADGWNDEDGWGLIGPEIEHG